MSLPASLPRPNGADHLDKLFPGSAEMAARMREVDWRRTAVGPIQTGGRIVCGRSSA